MTPANRRTLLRNIRTTLRTLPIGEEIYCRPLLDYIQGRILEDEIVRARNTVNTYPMPTATLQAAKTAMLALFA